MEQNKKLSLSDEVKKEADAIEQAVADNPELTEITVSDSLDKALLEKIGIYEKCRTQRTLLKKGTMDADKMGDVEFAQELMPNFPVRTNEPVEDMLSDEDKEALRLGREMLRKGKVEGEPLYIPDKEIHKHLNEPEKKSRVYRMPRKKKLLIALVAVMVLVVGTGVTSVGSKSYLKVLWEKIHGGQTMQVANVSDMESKEIEDGEEVTAFREIKDAFNISAVRFQFKPEGMRLKNYEINKEQGQAILFFKYKDQIIRYYIYLNAEDSSLSQRETDSEIDKFKIQSSKGYIEVTEYKVDNSDKNRFIAEFEYEGVYYEIKGIIDKPEIIEILKKLNYVKEKS